MVRSLFFHLGDRKTGSTSIQRALATGAGSCPGVTLLYPAKAHHIPLATALIPPAPPARRARLWQRLARTLAEADADIAVISAEDFESVPPAALQAAIAEFLPEHLHDARFLAYVRPHAERVLSSWTQQVKMGLFSGPLDAFHQRTLARGRFRYAERFGAWRATFGDRFTLRPMIRSRLKDADVVADFYDAVFAGATFALADQPRTNEALCLEDLALLQATQRQIRDTLGSSPLQAALGGRLAQILQTLPRPGQTKPQLHRALAERIAADYRADAAALDAAFFDDTPMTHALEAAPAKALDAPQPLDPAATMSPEERRLLRCWTDLVAGMLAEDPEGQLRTLRRGRVQALVGS